MSIQDIVFVLVGLVTILWPAGSFAQPSPIVPKPHGGTSESQLLCHAVKPQPGLGNRANSFRLELRENCSAVQDINPSAAYESQDMSRTPKDGRD
jgi:hypothetical protein